MVARYLTYLGYKVVFILNITEIDDKIAQRAKREGRSHQEIAEEYKAKCIEDMERLRINTITVYAPASHYLPQMIHQIQLLLEKGYAYTTKTGIYFDTSRFPSYGSLSHQTREEMELRRLELDPEKKNSTDFHLWRFDHNEGYDSPFGRGTPGWHIEDTAISLTHFGTSYDIHGGAVELIYPHHEAEIAQAEAYTGHKPFVRYWIHTGILKIGDEKMAKSTGNYITVRDALQRYSANLLRLYFLSTKYSRNMNFDVEKIERLKKKLNMLEKFWRKCREIGCTDTTAPLKPKNKTLLRRFAASMNNDFNTPAALKALYEAAEAINESTPSEAREVLKNSYSAVDQLLKTLGIDFRQDGV